MSFLQTVIKPTCYIFVQNYQVGDSSVAVIFQRVSKGT